MPKTRIFKTGWFAKRARKSGITDHELCAAMKQVQKGQADDLGGGVFKKRLNDNDDRSIILAKGGQYWIYQYIFPKQDKANIKRDELEDFRTLAKAYQKLTDSQLKELMKEGSFVEICNEN